MTETWKRRLETGSGQLQEVLLRGSFGRGDLIIAHQDAFEAPGAMAYVFKVITNLALKRIREGEVTSAR